MECGSFFFFCVLDVFVFVKAYCHLQMKFSEENSNRSRTNTELKILSQRYKSLHFTLVNSMGEYSMRESWVVFCACCDAHQLNSAFHWRLRQCLTNPSQNTSISHTYLCWTTDLSLLERYPKAYLCWFCFWCCLFVFSDRPSSAT